ncbi:RiPP maturation radical SAM C-methyltransferase [Streptomyces lavendulae]|uniref:RiPP maturation radical SAM C-methyltransferase n=1 Tax=Streptomyces lavendulae TaxID=1914 RepID=UPI0036BE6C5F
MPGAETASCDIALVSMPWAPPNEPCLGLSILKACLTRADLSARVFHFATDLLRWLKYDTYQFLSDWWGLNEFLFTGTLDPSLGEKQKAAVVQRILTYWKAGDGYQHDAYPTPDSILDLFMSVRHEVIPQFLDEAADRILLSGARIVGFTCLFDQTMASLALATKLKALKPELTVVFGGYALEGSPGRTVAQAFPCVDHFVVGDGEQAIVDLACHILGKPSLQQSRTPTPLRSLLPLTPSDSSRPIAGTDFLGSGTAPNVTAEKASLASQKIIHAPKYALNDSPIPDYDDWYEDLSLLERSHGIRVNTEVLPVESSRGCWWGQSKHCVFCGIDDETLKYRHKDASVTLDMLKELRARYGNATFRFSDYIMPKAYYTDLLPQLAQCRPRFRLHSEIKANHPPERIQLLVDAGFIAVQPGVESFSTSVLRSMDKGVRGIDNACLIKTGYNARLAIYYNILYGLPGDSTRAYEEMLGMIPRIYHLMPPASRTETVITRFAPLQVDPARFGISSNPVHHECYDALFSDQFLRRTGFSLDDYGYYFDRNFTFSPELKALYSQLVFQVDHWKKLHQTRFVELSFESIDASLKIKDSRFSAAADEYVLSREASLLYEKVEHRPISFDRVCAKLRSVGRLTVSEAEAGLAELEQRRLIWKEGELIFGLAVPRKVAAAHCEDRWPQTWRSIYV